MTVKTGKGKSGIEDLYPLTPLQQGLWFHELLESGSGAYLVQTVMRIEGSLNHDAFRRAWETVVSRHAILRTRIVWEGLEQPLQLVQPEVALPWEEQDWRGSPADDYQTRLRDFLDADHAQGLDLTQAPLMRLALLQDAEHSAIFVWSFHHLILDRWSVDVVLQEVGSAYEALVEGRPLELRPLRPYRGYLEWLKDQDIKRAEQHWRKLLTGFTAPTVLGIDQAPSKRAGDRDDSYDCNEVTLSEAATLALSEWARQQKLTVNTVVQGAWSLLLSRYSATEDVVFGTTVSGRSGRLDGIESMVGLFINTLPVRVHVPPRQCLAEWLRELQGQQVTLREYEHTPLFEIQKWSEVPAGEPLFNTLLVFENTPLESGEHLTTKAAGLDLKPVAGRGGNQTDYPLTVLVVPGRRLRLRFEFDTRSFTAAAVNRLVEHFQRVLAAMVGGTGQQGLVAISLLTEAECQQQLVDWNATETPYPHEACIHELFERQAQQTPDAVALVSGEDSLTYGELSHRANHLARYLQEQYGVGPEVCVGVCVERSMNMVIGILGILKAGGAYVPLDPKYPRPRLAYILEDAQVEVLITQESLVEGLPHSKARAICVDTDPACRPSGKVNTPESQVSSSNVAYLIYTSGSTGKPKGVAIEHRSAVALLHWAKGTFRAEELQGVLASTSICFDLSVFEMFAPLSWGGTVILAENVLELPDLPNVDGVTLINTVPSGMAGLLRTTSLPENVRTVNLAGEPLRPQLVKEIQQAGTVETVNDLYGPSEDTTYSTRALRDGDGPEIIGRPIANTQAYLLDRYLEPVPIGVSGELYLGGDGLARGYYNKRALTAEKFIPDPFAREPGARLYRTGDVARYLEDGTIQYLGRVDHQVKIRGYRIEPGEIEAIVTQHPAVAESVVAVREDEPGDKRVVAYVALDPDQAETLLHTESEVWSEERVYESQTVWEQTYGNSSAVPDSTFDVTGWNSSYTGEPIPVNEMREWVDATADRIRALGPQRVLEFGCGTGLLLYELAPQCREYRGTDFSNVVIQKLKKQVAARPDLSHVVLEHRVANDFTDIAEGSFDTVIINSVAQYFPGLDYLGQVLEGAAHAVKPGGQVVVGDVRSLPLLTAYHASIQLHRANGALSTKELAQRIQQARAREEELVIDPAFFTAIAEQVPRIGRVEVLLKQGSAHNELTRYRYDVILHIEPSERATEPEGEPIQWRDWTKEKLSVQDLQAWLDAEAPAAVGFTGIPNERLAPDLRMLALLAEETGPDTVDDLREALAAQETQALDPQAIWDAVSRSPYWCEVGLEGSGDEGTMTAVLRRRSSEQRPCLLPRSPGHESSDGAWNHLGTDPLKAKTERTVIPQLRAYLEEELPEHMFPSAFVILERLPLTPNGKVDRKALPVPEGSRALLATAFVMPQTPTEEQLAKTWREVLGLERVGIQDNFFELGGHSLLATQVISRVRELFDIDVPLRHLFEGPTIERLAKVIENTRRAGQDSTAPSLVPRSQTGPVPLSFAQERLWLLEQLDPGSTAYSMPAAFRLSGPLNVPALEESLSRLIQRHEVLRTHYAFIKEEAVQVIAPGGDFSLPVIDLEDHPADEQESALRQQIEEEHNRPFDLDRGPLFRATLIRISPADHVLVLVLHHSVADGLSTVILYREVATGYEAADCGMAGDQRPLPIQYADYAVWQRQWLRGEALDALLTYWTEQLADAPRQLDLPTDFPRPAVQTHRGVQHTVQLPESVVSSLRAMSQSEGVTMYMSVLAAFALVLSRHTGEEDIVVGTPVANRPRPELEGMIGLFLNTLVLRTKLSGDPTLRELLRRVQEVCLGAYAHQELPFERLVEALQPERDLSRTPLFQVFLNLIDLSETNLDLPGLAVTRLGSSVETAKFDLTLYVFLTGTGATVQWSYNSDLFDASTIEWMAEHFQTVLMQLHETLDQPISSVSVLQEENRAQLLAPPDPIFRTQAFTAFPEAALAESIPCRFERQVRERPDQLAVHTPQYQWTYAEVNRRANQIAHTLLSQGFPSDARVALLCAQDAPMVAAILGVLKAGYTYVPLDPFSPPTRLESIVADADTKAVLAESTYLSLAHEIGDAAGLVLDIDDASANAADSNPQHSVSPEALAYVLYTSGTTGVPKGVMQSHRNVLHHIRVYTNKLHLQAEDRLTLLASYGFDAAVMDLFGALLNGATLYPFDLREADTTDLAAWMKQHAITVYHSTPTVYRYWIDALQAGTSLPAVRLVVLGGEAASGADFKAFQRNFGPSCVFVNGLGPTESTLSLQFVADHSTKIIGQTVPVGHPVEHTEISLLNQDGKATEVYGEIAIRSPYVAIGYWNQPELTRRAFGPAMESGGARLYRTGDMGRRRYDGSLEFMGRKDTQVKIRGYRIELGEIESALAQHLLIQKAVVVYRDDGPAGPYLVAYLLTARDTIVSSDALRSFLKERLPEYMVPSAWVGLDIFPLTPNGKIDRKALPLPDAPQDRDDFEVVAARTPIEAEIAAIWQTVLRLDQVGIHNNFFDLGGHSLLATQVMSRVRESFAVTLPLRLLFEAPTVAELAAAITNNEESSSTGSLAPIQALPPGAPLSLSFSQERMWFLYQLSPNSPAYNLYQAIYFPGPVDFAALEQAVNEIRRRHDVLRTVYPMQDGSPEPQIQPYSPFSIPIKDFRDSPEETQSALAQRFATDEARRTFDMARGPLMRAVFLRMQADQVIVLLTLHHIVSDGWSAAVLRRELEALYEAYAAGQPSPLDALPIQYQDFAAWQRGWLQGELLDAQLKYWTERLAGAPTILDLPLDRPRGALQTSNGGIHVVKFSRELTVGLTQLTQQEGATLFMALHAGLSILLGRYTASDDLLLGVPIANRHFLALESLIGTFVNTLVLRAQLAGNPSFLELLQQVRHNTLEAYAHQDLPFEVLVDAMRPARDLSRSPVFQVMLSVLNIQNALTTAKKKFSGVIVDRQAAQFDLTVAVAEFPDDRHSMAWTYNSDLFEHATIERMSAHFVHLLEELVAHPQRRIHDPALLPDHERQQLLVEWNATAQPGVSPGQCLPAILEAQAAQQPDSIAVVFEGQAVTYGHLNQRANQLAHYLRKLGVGPDIRVAIHCERSLDMILAVWGTVKAGGTYVPIDPTYPQERVALMLEDAEVAVVLAQQHSQYTLPPHAAKVVWMDADRAAIEQEPKYNPPTEITPDNLVYMIYTSGSTGKPKGVQIPHRALMNFLQTMAREPGMDVSDRLLAVTSLSFDIAGLELFLPVLVGGQMVLASNEMAADGIQLIECLENEGITVMQATPVTWQVLLAQGWKGTPGLRALCGGEQLSLEVAQQILERGHGLWNLYGPTETTIWSTVSALAPETERISIGRPIGNTQIYLLDPWGHPVPIGAPGELYIGGDGVARGYWQRPDITASQFVPNLYSAVPGIRMYRTGDLARYRPDGQLEWLARVDNQIKLRGYRIELGEIEAVLRRQPSVGEAVVLIRNESVEDGQLVAYVSTEAEDSFDQAGLRESLQKILPGYMVPSVFMEVEAFPLTPNGKIDRKALPAPEAADRTRGTSYEAPRTVLEELLVEVWQEILNIDRIGIHDNFFELGGHSLSATRVIARLRDELDLDIPLRCIFEYPEIEQLTLDVTALLAATDAEA